MHDQLTLQINKVNISVDRDRLKYDQNERGKIVDVTVLDTDGLKAYDLTGKNIRFFDLKQGTPPKIISDDGSTSTGGKFIRTPENDKLGKFSYQFQEFTYQQSGEAHFEFYTDKDHVDVTSHFAIDIIAEGQIAPDNSSYVSSMAELIDQLKAATDHASDSIGALTTASDTAKKTATDAIQAMQEQVATYAKQVTDAQAQWAQTKQDIDNRANAQLSSIQDLDKAQVDAAVKSITDKRDLALKQLNDDKTAKLNAIQQDYNSWKTNTIDDFTRSVQPLKDSIAENSEQLNQVSKQVNDTVTNMAALEKQFNSVDFTKFAKLSDLSNYYTKAEVDDRLSSAGKVKTVDNIQPDSNGNITTDHYTKSQTDQKLGQKITFVKCDSPQAAYDASNKLADDGSIQIGIYDMNDGATSAVIGDQTVTIETLYNALNSLSTTTNGLNSSLTSLQSTVNSKANSTDLASLQNTVNNIDSTRTPIVAGASGDDLFAFKTNQIRLYPGNGNTCKNLPPAANAQWFTVQYIFETPNNDGIAIFRSPANEVWTIGNNGGTYTTSWVKLANSVDITNLQNQIQAQQTAIETGYMKKPTVISKADYDKLATKDPNTLYEITE